MTQPQTLLQAALNRLSARLGSGLADAAADLAVLAQDAPERLRQEWDLFREEVEQEARRLERPEGDGDAAAGTADWAPAPEAGPDPQRQVDDLRATVARLARRLEDRS